MLYLWNLWEPVRVCMCKHQKLTSVVSDSVWTHRWQPTRLPCPWDSPGKNTGGGCHFLLQCMKVKSENEVSQSCPTLRDPMDCSPPGSFIRGIFQARVLEWVAISFPITEASGYLSFFLNTQYLNLPPASRDFLTLCLSGRQSLPLLMLRVSVAHDPSLLPAAIGRDCILTSCS